MHPFKSLLSNLSNGSVYGVLGGGAASDDEESQRRQSQRFEREDGTSAYWQTTSSSSSSSSGSSDSEVEVEVKRECLIDDPLIRSERKRENAEPQGGGDCDEFNEWEAMADALWSRTMWQNIRVKAGGVWHESSGSLGDVGTFVPLVLALSLVNGLDLGTTLIFTGIYNVITGLVFGVPMPVQPMKSIAAVAIAEGDPLTVPQIMAAGLSTATVLAFLGLTGLMSVVNRLVPLPVVRGIQLSQGISFGTAAVKYILYNQDLKTTKSAGDRPWLGSDGIVLALSAFTFVILVTGVGGGGNRHGIMEARIRDEEASGEEPLLGGEGSGVEGEPDSVLKWCRKNLEVVPSALIVFAVGIIIAIARDPSVMGELRFGPSPIHLVSISWEDWKIGFVRAAVPQLPLSILNSVIAVCKLSKDIFPTKEVSVLAVSTSVGFMNLVGCWFGAMPVCHGAGGLAGQYRFGARTGLSVVILGTAKLVLGLLLGSSLLRLLAQFPIGLLGVLLFFSGVELAMACRDQSTRLDAFVMLVVTVVSLGTSAASGFIGGLILWLMVKLHEQFTYNAACPLGA